MLLSLKNNGKNISHMICYMLQAMMVTETTRKSTKSSWRKETKSKQEWLKILEHIIFWFLYCGGPMRAFQPYRRCFYYLPQNFLYARLPFILYRDRNWLNRALLVLHRCFDDGHAQTFSYTYSVFFASLLFSFL